MINSKKKLSSCTGWAGAYMVGVDLIIKKRESNNATDVLIQFFYVSVVGCIIVPPLAGPF